MELSMSEFKKLCEGFGIHVDRVSTDRVCDEGGVRVYLSSPFPQELINPLTTNDKISSVVNMEKYFPDVYILAKKGNIYKSRLQAIKLLRDMTGISLVEARDAVDRVVVSVE